MPDNKPLTPEEVEAVSCAYWANRNQILLPSGPFTFKNHEYLVDSMQMPIKKSKREQIYVKKKGTQVGGSISMTLICIHGCIKGLFPQGVGYVMPSEPEVQSFGKTKFAPIIQLNPDTIARHVKSGGKGTDSAELKKVGNSFIHFKSASPNKMVSGERTSSAATSFSCDILVFDEVDMMDLVIAEKFKGRVDHSELKILVYLSNPTAVNYGIDELFQQSDQRYWHWLCPQCNKYTCPDLEFISGTPETTIKCRPDGTGYIACKHCGAELPIYYKNPKTKAKSFWVPTYKDREINGEHYSHLMAPHFHDPYKLLMSFYNPPDGKLKEIMRKDFGCAYTPKEDQLPPWMVYECCGNEPMAFRHDGPCVMGVDVMNSIHLSIGFRKTLDQYEIIKCAKVATFNDVYDLAKKYNVKIMGLDIAPDIHAAKQFQKKMRGSCRVFLVDYRTSKHVGPFGLDEENQIIKASRTEAMDYTHNMVMNKKVTFFRREQAEEFAKQVCNPFKQMIKNERTGLPEYRYTGKNDHYRHTLNYLFLAAQCGRAPLVKPKGYSRQKQCVNS